MSKSRTVIATAVAVVGAAVAVPLQHAESVRHIGPVPYVSLVDLPDHSDSPHVPEGVFTEYLPAAESGTASTVRAGQSGWAYAGGSIPTIVSVQDAPGRSFPAPEATRFSA